MENSSYKLAIGLAACGHDVKVVTSSRGKAPRKYVEKMGPLTVIRYPEKHFILEAPLVPKIALAALWEDYDILHVHGMTPPITDLAILFAKFRRKPVVLTYHNDAHLTKPNALGRLVESVYSKFAIPVIALTDKIVSSTQSYAATSPVLRHFLKKVTVIPWGTDASLRRRIQRQEIRSSFESDEKKRLLFVGQLKDYKGVNILLEAVACLNQNGHQIAADIVGDGPHLNSLKSTARRLGLNGNARFWGAVNDQTLSDMYDGCDALVLPSLNRREAFGLVQLDAFAAGKTVVASNIAGVNDVATMGRGYLARPNDVASLVENISLALKFPIESRYLRNIAQDLTWTNVSKKYENVLSETIRNIRTSLILLVSSAALVTYLSNGGTALSYAVHTVSSLFA